MGGGPRSSRPLRGLAASFVVSFVLLALSAIGISTSAAPPTPTFVAVDLGALAGATDSRATAINDIGEVVGVSGGLPFVWSASAGMRPLPEMDDWAFTTPHDINAGGLVVGETRVLGLGLGILWTRTLNGYDASLLPLPAGFDESFAFGLNDQGAAVGCMRGPSLPQLAVVWKPAGAVYGVPESLPGLPETSSDCATSVNEDGDVAGWSGPVLPGPYHAVRWTRRVAAFEVRDLGVLRGGFWSQAWGINDRGAVVGESSSSGDAIHGFLWSHALRDLGTLGGFTSSARAINNDGFVVGSSATSLGTVHAYLVARRVKIDLGTLPGGTSSFATDINELEVIAGASTVAGSTGDHATLWLPTGSPG